MDMQSRLSDLIDEEEEAKRDWASTNRGYVRINYDPKAPRQVVGHVCGFSKRKQPVHTTRPLQPEEQ